MGVTVSPPTNAPHQLLYFDPHPLRWPGEIELQDLEIANYRVDLQFWREDNITYWDAVVKSGKVGIKQQSWQNDSTVNRNV
ncbi:hypothetical protein [Umezakia ovalisporum]|uniref:Uncharacterized protein n=2 Tax=Umezakia ovalisporum TaxID=75695 RepID=A0AA43KFF1_9CYAN|nr:hypothetical protein [Umezakia ovalisporum]MDH6055409.1 hypothetical protein [Umezakia ovalisporum FSS-43]MDH6064110.1 hypothetical protein [Umezakia ovalisporum FSS-62]MDH6071068.1 hypothetical protein [Umezakia ovalisporum CobakiLakeA]MDH6075998.1 hypothetical protein [Umezakia ovalisporum CS-1034]MDH6081189.1 hypothetical protein [Umezakia ovalisporum FSS-44]